jgi:hypothetical protein
MAVRFHIDDIPVTIMNAIRDEVTILYTALEGALALKTRSKGAVASSLLVGSYVSNITHAAGKFRATLGSPLEYGEYVEFGAQPHWAPIEPFLKWAEHKGAHVLSMEIAFEGGKTRATGRRQALRGNARDRAIENLAYAVRFKIAREGMKGKKIFQEVLDEHGFRYSINHEATVSYYSIDISGYLQNRLDAVLK